MCVHVKCVHVNCVHVKFKCVYIQCHVSMEHVEYYNSVCGLDTWPGGVLTSVAMFSYQQIIMIQ